MTGRGEVTYRPGGQRALWLFAGLGLAGVVLAGTLTAFQGRLAVVWAFAGPLSALLCLMCLYGATLQVGADAYGVHSQSLLRRRHVPWRDVADVGEYQQRSRHGVIRRVVLVRHDGRRQRLPLPFDGPPGDFDAKLAELRALHRRHGSPASGHVPVITLRTAGRGLAVPLALCVTLLAGAGLLALFVPVAEAEKREWTSATPCTAGTPAAERRECLTTLPAVIARTEVGQRKGEDSWLYFVDGQPLERASVSREGAAGFQPGDEVELTFWRGEVREVVGERHVWRDHFAEAGVVAVIAATSALAAGYPGAVALLRRRGRRLPVDEVLPSALPFAGVLVGTALWLLPLCYLHPTTLLSSPVAMAWAAAGSLATLGLFAWAWRATRVPDSGKVAPAEQPEGSPEKEVFLAARFLEATEYNPYGSFGTHIVLGSGPPAVTPHSGPGRFAAQPIPVRRLSVLSVRRVRGDDGDTVPRDWHVAELDDAGTPVRLAAPPRNLTRILRELERAPATP